MKAPGTLATGIVARTYVAHTTRTGIAEPETSKRCLWTGMGNELYINISCYDYKHPVLTSSFLVFSSHSIITNLSGKIPLASVGALG